VSAQSIKAAAARGVRWNGLATVLRVGFLTARMVVLARLLSQRDFGLASMVGVVLGYAQAYVDLGLSSALIQKQEQDPDRLSTIFWINLMAGLLSGALLFALQKPVSLLFNEPGLVSLIAVSALQLPLVALGQQFEALFQRDLRFKLLAVVQIGADAVNTALAFVLALKGHGAWALVLGTLTGAALNSAGLFALGVQHWPVRFAFRPSEIKSHLRFGAYQLANINVGYLTANLDTIIIGRYLGTEAVGVYSLAQRVTQLPKRYINPVIAKVAFPVFAKQNRDKAQMAESLLQLQRSLSHLNAPLIVGLCLVAPLLIPLVYGQKWQSSVPLVQLLCALGLVGGVSGPTQLVRTALGHVRFNFHWTWITGIAYGLVMWAAASSGLMGIVLARTLLGFVLGVAMIAITLRFLETSFLRFLGTLRIPALGSILMAGSVYGVFHLPVPMPDVARLMVAIVAGAVTYIGISAWLDREFLERSLRLLLGLKSKGKVAPVVPPSEDVREP
jgi:O-antigen/teichoic acid export membrane protein